eukprot:gene17860-biopygen28394
MPEMQEKTKATKSTKTANPRECIPDQLNRTLWLGAGNLLVLEEVLYQHMQRYLDISIKQMSADFEIVRKALGIERWLVFGGSWGSTLGKAGLPQYNKDRGPRYASYRASRVARGTKPEFDAIYARKSFDGNARRQAEFDTFFEVAAALGAVGR